MAPAKKLYGNSAISGYIATIPYRFILHQGYTMVIAGTLGRGTTGAEYEIDHATNTSVVCLPASL